MKKLDNKQIEQHNGEFFERIGRKLEIMHGVYEVNGKRRIYWEGKRISLDHPDSIYFESKNGMSMSAYAGDIIYDSGSGPYVEYSDQDGGECGWYFDLIDQEFKRY